MQHTQPEAFAKASFDDNGEFMAEPWLMRVEGGLSAHFIVPDGPSRPGVHWTIGLKQGEQIYTVLVKTLFADDATPETRADEEYQGQVAMQYLNDCLNNGWHPDEQTEHTIYISNPIPD